MLRFICIRKQFVYRRREKDMYSSSLPGFARGMVEEVDAMFGIVPLQIDSYYVYSPDAEDDDQIHKRSGYPVKVVSGKYFGAHGLSNFWYWQRVRADGSLDPREENGYGQHWKFRLISSSKATELAGKLA